MEIQSIDLYGDFLLNGSTGSDGQVLTFNETGGFTWGTASTGGGGGGGPSSSYAKLDGYNYVICETLNTGNTASDALNNGNNLFNAYTQAKNLNVGGLSSTNRVSVLLMPGDYDLGDGGQFQLDTSYVDIIGVSTNPYNTVLRSSGQYATLQYTSPIDTALRNVYLKPGTTLAVDDNGGTGDGSYLRWDNVVLEGNSFNDGGFANGFQNIYGEFKNIEILDNTNAFVTATGSIHGVFENIKIGYGGSSIAIIPFPENPNLTLSGTFSDIVIDSGGIALTSFGNISGTFRNIICDSQLLNSNFNVEGTFENIESINGIFTSGNNLATGYIKGTFKNLKLGGSSFVTYDYIDGIFENVELNANDGTFFCVGNLIGATLSGTFSNIRIIGDASTAFTGAKTILGNYNDIKIGSVTYSVFATDVPTLGVDIGQINGNFKNIEIGGVGQRVFSTQNYLQGNFENIKIGNLSKNNVGAFTTDYSTYLTESYLDGNFSNISIGNSNDAGFFTFFTGGTFSGTFSDITQVGGISLTSFMSWWGDLYGNFESLTIGDGLQAFYGRNNINASLNNLKFGKVDNIMNVQNESIFATLSNVYISSTTYSFTATEFLHLNINNFDCEQSGPIFFLNGTMSGEYRNIKISKCFSNFGFSYNLDCTVDNLIVNQMTDADGSYLFYSDNTMRGTYSNIWSTGFDRVFNSTIAGGFLNCNFNHLRLGTRTKTGADAPTNFTGDMDASKMKDVWVSGGGLGLTLKISNGLTEVLDSRFTSLSDWYLLLNNAYGSPVVENCYLVTSDLSPNSSSIWSAGNGISNVQILHTLTNEGYYDGSTKFPPVPADTLMSPNFSFTTGIYSY